MTAALIDIPARADLVPPRPGRTAAADPPCTSFDEAIGEAVDRTRSGPRDDLPRRDRADRDEERAAESGLTPGPVDSPPADRGTRRGSIYDASHHVVTRRAAGPGGPTIPAGRAQTSGADDHGRPQDVDADAPRSASSTALGDERSPARDAEVTVRSRPDAGARRIDGRRIRHGDGTDMGAGSPATTSPAGAAAEPEPVTAARRRGAATAAAAAHQPATRPGYSADAALEVRPGGLPPAASGGDRAESSYLATADRGPAARTVRQPTGVEVTAVPTVTAATINSTPVAAPTPVAPPPLPIAQPDIAGILGQLRGRADGTYQLRAMVHPAELGAVTITATVSHGSVSLLLHADAQAQHTVSQSLPQLRDHLADLGFTGVDVGLGSPDRHAQDGDRPDENHAQGSDHGIGNTADVTTDEGTAIRRRHAGAIDAML